jgi:hypothetical protein
MRSSASADQRHGGGRAHIHDPLHLHHAAYDDHRLAYPSAVVHLVRRGEALEDLAADGVAQHGGVSVLSRDETYGKFVLTA